METCINKKRSLKLAAMGAGITALAVGSVFTWRSSTTPPVQEQRHTSARQHYNAGQRSLARGDTPAALREWEIALDADPAYSAPYFAIAQAYEDAGRFANAVKVLDILQRVSPTARSVECRQAELYFEMRRVEKAYAVARDATTKDPGCALGHSILGMTLAASGDMTGALRELRKAHELVPADERTTLELAQMLGEASHAAEGIELVRSLLPHSHRPAQACYIIGWLLAEHGHGRDREAMSYLDKSLKLMPDYKRSSAEYGILLARQGKDQQSRPYLERALRSSGAESQTVEALATVYIRLHLPVAKKIQQRAEALRQFNQALEQARRQYLLHPDDAKSNLKLAALEAQNGDPEDALDLTRSTLEKDPNNPAALSLAHKLTRPVYRIPVEATLASER